MSVLAEKLKQNTKRTGLLAVLNSRFPSISPIAPLDVICRDGRKSLMEDRAGIAYWVKTVGMTQQARQDMTSCVWT